MNNSRIKNIKISKIKMIGIKIKLKKKIFLPLIRNLKIYTMENYKKMHYHHHILKFPILVLKHKINLNILIWILASLISELMNRSNKQETILKIIDPWKKNIKINKQIQTNNFIVKTQNHIHFLVYLDENEIKWSLVKKKILIKIILISFLMNLI